MKAMILAAGRGERMKPLTVITPKPLVMVGNTTLIGHTLQRLYEAGVREVIINVHHLYQQILDECGNGDAFGLEIKYSIEEELLETGGGVFRALPLLGDEPFLLMSADIWTDYPLEKLLNKSVDAAHLVFVNNPDFHEQGDYGLDANGVVHRDTKIKYTYGNIGIIHPTLFRNEKDGVFRLTHVLNPAIDKGLVTGEIYTGDWHNIGTMAQLNRLREKIV